MPVPQPLPLAVFISGGGTTLRNLIEQIAAQKLPAEIRLVLSSHPTARGLEYAAAAGIPTRVVSHARSESPEAYAAAMFEPCRAAGVKLVIMGGFLKHVLIPPDFENRVLNIHPSLIPSFCGRGMYGHRVHEAVIAFGAKVSGCTVHFVDNDFDHGPIVAQRAVPVLDGDTPEDLAARIFREECEAFPEAIRWFAAGELHVSGRKVTRNPQGQEGELS